MTETPMDVPWQRTFEDLGSLATGKRHVFKIGREAVPIVFVPGIMGTRLKARVGGTPIWDPDDSWFMLKRFGLPGIDPRDRQATILGATRTYDSKVEYAVPFGSEDTEHNRDIEEEFPNATRRGWSEVYWEGYRPILSALQTARWPLFVARCFDLPVYACGYDWRGSARDAGLAVASGLLRHDDDGGGARQHVAAGLGARVGWLPHEWPVGFVGGADVRLLWEDAGIGRSLRLAGPVTLVSAALRWQPLLRRRPSSPLPLELRRSPFRPLSFDLGFVRYFGGRRFDEGRALFFSVGMAWLTP